MKITIQKKYLSEQAEQFIRTRAGYAHIHSHHTDQDSFVLRLTRDHYPRLHMYIKDLGEKVEFNLHLDQKQASYQGNHMHNAEYDGAVVEREIARLKNLLRQNVPTSAAFSGQNISDANTETKIGQGTYPMGDATVPKKSLFRKIFNF